MPIGPDAAEGIPCSCATWNRGAGEWGLCGHSHGSPEGAARTGRLDHALLPGLGPVRAGGERAGGSMISGDTIDLLAVFGGAPAFTQPLHVGRPNVGARQPFLERVESILDSKRLTNNGPQVQSFERRLEEITGVRHCVAVCNATVGLEILIRGLGLSGEVILPSFTFAATASAIAWVGLRPIFCDIDPATHNLFPGGIEAAISPRTTAILGVHVWGRPCDIDGLRAVARRHSLHLLFDAAHAFGCTYRGRPIGGFGEAEVFSFHATKFANTFEGGAIATNDDDLAARLRRTRNFGLQGADQVVEVGTNGKMSEIAAAMGLTSLDDIDQTVAANRSNYLEYLGALSDIPGISVARHDLSEQCNFQYVVAEVDAPAAGLGRDDLIRVLQAENVLARRYFYPGCHQMDPYRSHSARDQASLPATEWLVQRTVAFPTGPAVSAQDIRTIGRLVALAVRHGPEIQARLAGAE